MEKAYMNISSTQSHLPGVFDTEEEARAHWESFYHKGIKGKILKVIIVDDVEGKQEDTHGKK
jgi:hypothetical protein